MTELRLGTTKNREGRVFVFSGLDDLRRVLEAQWAEHEKLAKKADFKPWVTFVWPASRMAMQTRT